jgi:hypothetical protein
VPGPRPTRVRGWRRAGAAGPDRRSGASPPPTAWEVSSIRPIGASHSHIREGLSDGLLLHPHTIVSMLVNDLADIDNEVFLFLDDYHSVTDPAIRGAVSFLLRYAPSHFHLVLTTRLEPPLLLGGLLAKNQLLEVDASVLRFDYSFARPVSSRGACLHPPRADGTVRDV